MMLRMSRAVVLSRTPVHKGRVLDIGVERVRLPSGVETDLEMIRHPGAAAIVQTTGRHDPCVGIRATPIAEAMLACVLMDQALRHRGQCGDIAPPTRLG